MFNKNPIQNVHLLLRSAYQLTVNHPILVIGSKSILCEEIIQKARNEEFESINFDILLEYKIKSYHLDHVSVSWMLVSRLPGWLSISCASAMRDFDDQPVGLPAAGAP